MQRRISTANLRSLSLAMLVTACEAGAGADEAETTADSATTDLTSAEPTDTSAGTDTTGEPADFDPIEATLDDVKQQVAAGPVTCRTLVTRYQELFTARDPQLSAILTWKPLRKLHAATHRGLAGRGRHERRRRSRLALRRRRVARSRPAGAHQQDHHGARTRQHPPRTVVKRSPEIPRQDVT